MKRAIKIDKRTATCAARRIIVLYEANRDERVAKWARACENCEYAKDCRGDWDKTLEPLLGFSGYRLVYLKNSPPSV